jgi:hypothetical protein
VPAAELQPSIWRYTTNAPAENWFKADFNDSGWNRGPGGFGTKGTPGAIIGTEWNSAQLWLRREIVLPDRPVKNPLRLMIYDENPEVVPRIVTEAPEVLSLGWNPRFASVCLPVDIRRGVTQLSVRGWPKEITSVSSGQHRSTVVPQSNSAWLRHSSMVFWIFWD